MFVHQGVCSELCMCCVSLIHSFTSYFRGPRFEGYINHDRNMNFMKDPGVIADKSIWREGGRALNRVCSARNIRP